MAQVDLEIGSVTTSNFSVDALRMQDDDGSLAEATFGQKAILTLDNMPSNADSITSVAIYIQAGVNPEKTVGQLDVKLLASGVTMIREQAFSVDAPGGSPATYTSTAWNDYISGGSTPSRTPTVINDMQLQVKHAGNLAGTPTLQIDYAFARVVYTETVSSPPTKISSGLIKINSGLIKM